MTFPCARKLGLKQLLLTQNVIVKDQNAIVKKGTSLASYISVLMVDEQPCEFHGGVILARDQ